MGNILVVDDEEGFRHILKVVLQRAGHAVSTAPSAEHAFEVIQGQSFDLLILDDMMPGMTGSDLCIQLKADPRYAAIPVLMHTANMRLRNPTIVQSIGADAVLLKPSTPREVVEMVSRLVNQAPA
jgi:CheY-like chemotaxis protein